MLYSPDCGNPSNLTDGFVAFTKTSYQSEATYTCTPGYTLVGDAIRECLINGRWSNADPVCQIKGINILLQSNCFVYMQFLSLARIKDNKISSFFLNSAISSFYYIGLTFICI